jgi:small subunit ribosomal protein S16
MLAIRMQRTGRSGHAQFRLVVQDSHRSPKSGSIVYALGSYNPHTKEISVDKEKAAFYLEHGAQPSSRVAVLLKNEGVKLPKWVKVSSGKEAAIRNPDKRRSTRPVEETTEAVAEPVAEEPVVEVTTEPVPAAEEPAESPEDSKEA